MLMLIYADVNVQLTDYQADVAVHRKVCKENAESNRGASCK